MPKVQLLLVVLFLLSVTSRVDSRSPSENTLQQNAYKNLVYRDNIRTVLMHVKGWEMSYPVIEYGNNDELIFSFDDLDGDVKNYQYRIFTVTPTGLLPPSSLQITWKVLMKTRSKITDSHSILS